MITSVCQTCGSDFSCYPSQKRKYCSKKCTPVNVGNKVRWKDKIAVDVICAICQTPFSVRPSRAKKYNVKYCSYKCHQVGEGRKAGAKRGEQMKAQSQGKSYPKIKGRHAHRVIAEEILGRPLVAGEIVHHKNENKQDYSEENLQVLPSQSEHMKIHVEIRKQNGKPN